MEDAEIRQFIQEMPNEVFERISLSVPWQEGVIQEARADPDGAPGGASAAKEEDEFYRDRAQEECWKKFNRNPWINTAVRGQSGRITGLGFEASSEIWEIQEAIERVELDPRNRLYHYWSRYVVRALVEGELFLVLTVHGDGFVEVDFLDPASLAHKGTAGTGIIFHPRKPLFPLFYIVDREDENGSTYEEQIPSINVARWPDELVKLARQHKDFDPAAQKDSRGSWWRPKFKSTGGYRRFVVAWDRGYVTRRAVSYIRTTLEWINHYENLKKYEIDHKKSSGAYAWVYQFEDVRSFKLWVSLTDEERAKTGMMGKMVPGARLFVPPGCKLAPQNPNLSSISDTDTDIAQMAISGLNEPADITTGQVKGTYASVKATRGPMSDRVSDEVADFDRFYRHDFWGSVFYLMSAVSGFPETFMVEEAVRFKNGEPEFKEVPRRPELLVDVQYPISETIELESRAKAINGVKHGPLTETIGIPQSRAAKMLGISGYGRNRLRKATEDKKYPKLVYGAGVDAETLQEKMEGEKPKGDKDADVQE